MLPLAVASIANIEVGTRVTPAQVQQPFVLHRITGLQPVRYDKRRRDEGCTRGRKRSSGRMGAQR